MESRIIYIGDLKKRILIYLGFAFLIRYLILISPHEQYYVGA